MPDSSNGGEIAPDSIEHAWQRVLEEWTDDDAHRKFLALCESMGCLDEAGRHYRDIKESDPDRSERADAEINRLLVRAYASLAHLKSEPEAHQGARRFITCFGLILAVALVGSAAGLYLGSF